MMMLTIVVLVTMTMAKSEEKTITVSEFTNTVKQVPSNVSNWAQSEWSDIKEHQKIAWQEGKEQNAKNWSKIKSFFTNLTGGKNDG
jgi:hypothetical protein